MPVRRVFALSLCLALFVVAPAVALVGTFEGGDGNQDADCAGATRDWRCFTAGQRLLLTDGTGPGDDVFSGGSKEHEPNGWAYTTGTQDKTDVQAGWLAVVPGPASTSYLDVAF